MNEVRLEFIQLMKFKESIEDKVERLVALKPQSPGDSMVINAQFHGYRAIIGEIDIFLENGADDESDKFSYINEPDDIT